MKRCGWVTDDPLYIQYHDAEWGIPVHDDKVLFEFLILESAQAGLSWITILRKREAYRLSYDGFDYNKVALYDDEKIEELLSNPNIIRNRRKIEASINNAKRFLEVRKEFGSFDHYIWGFVDGKPLVNSWEDITQIPASTPLSTRISKDLKKKGFLFIGPTIIYSYLQAVGIIDDHVDSCYKRMDR